MRLIQEDYLDDPWKVLVACILLNRTQGVTARPIINELFKRWPTSTDASQADPEDICDLVAGLGLRKRGYYIFAMSKDMHTLRNVPVTRINVLVLPGCGTYALEAWNMLVLGKRDFIPKDVKLRQRMEELTHDG